MSGARILIDCRDCGGGGCPECREKGVRMVALVRPKDLHMPRALDHFMEVRESCPCYQGFSINHGVAQCTHADHRDEGECCEPRSCPVVAAKATEGPAP
ncbi:hypothetical protein D3C86_1321430 [compost metagenome]